MIFSEQKNLHCVVNALIGLEKRRKHEYDSSLQRAEIQNYLWRCESSKRRKSCKENASFYKGAGQINVQLSLSLCNKIKIDFSFVLFRFFFVFFCLKKKKNRNAYANYSTSFEQSWMRGRGKGALYKRSLHQWLATGLCWTQTPTCIGLSDRSLPLAEGPGAPDREVELLGAEVDEVEGSLPLPPPPPMWCCCPTPVTEDDEVAEEDEPGPFILLNAEG